MKRILSLGLSICMLLSVLTLGVWAEAETEAVPNEMTAYLIGYEIIEQDDLTELDAPITRKEFVKEILNLFVMENGVAAEVTETPYVDVDPSDEYAPYIVFGSERGFLHGYEDGTFRPDGSVEIAEAAKVLISCLGYDKVIEAEGGYPAGSNRLASKLGLTQDVTSSGVATKAEIFSMFFHALNAEELVSDYAVEPKYTQSGKTLKEFLAAQRKITEGEGIVYGNEKFPLTDDVTADAEHITIGAYTCQIGGFDFTDYIGRKVLYFAKQGDNKRDTITHMFQLDYNKELFLNRDSNGCLNGTAVSYYNENGRKLTAQLDGEGYDVVRNYRPDFTIKDEDFEGDVVMVDNDADGKYEVFLVISKKTYRISGVQPSLGSVNFKIENWQNTAEVVGLSNLDEANDARTILVNDSDGADLTLEDLQKNDVVTLIVSDDQEFVSITRENRYVTGTITAIKEEAIEISGESYQVHRLSDGNMPFGLTELGITGKFYVDQHGELIYYVDEKELTENYAYVMNMQSTGAFSSRVQLRLLSPGRMNYIFEEYEDGTTSESLKVGNGDIGVYDVASKLSLDNVSVRSSQLVDEGLLQIGDIVRYETNAQGEITKIETPVKYYADTNYAVSRKFNIFTDSKAETEQEETVFAFGGINKGAFKVDLENSAAFCLPPQSGEEYQITGDASYSISGDDDYFDLVTMNDGTSYYTRAYDFDEDDSTVKVFAVVSGLNANRSDEVLSSSPWSIVSDSMITLNENGDAVYAIDGYSEGKSFHAVSQSGNANGLSATLQAMEPGDVFKYTENTRGEIYELSNRSDIFSIRGDITDLRSGFYSASVGNLYGKVMNIKRKIISESDVSYIHSLAVNYGDSTMNITCSYSDTAIYVYNRKTDEVTVGTADDIYSYEETQNEDSCSWIFTKTDANYNAEIVVIVLDR
ncbi:MAG: S-layer homology domain-containing protein [Clostridia bacterium]|nr:S-layer homology domain-containing protein [Clostridia bacterium]